MDVFKVSADVTITKIVITFASNGIVSFSCKDEINNDVFISAITIDRMTKLPIIQTTLKIRPGTPLGAISPYLKVI